MNSFEWLMKTDFSSHKNTDRWLYGQLGAGELAVNKETDPKLQVRNLCASCLWAPRLPLPLLHYTLMRD